MDDSQQTQLFAVEINNVVNRFKQEFDLRGVNAIGVLSMQIRLIQDEIISDLEDEE